METYHGDFAQLRQAFLDFLHNLPFYGLAVVCIDDPVIQALLPEISRPLITYGIAEQADFRASDITHAGSSSRFMVARPGSPARIEVQLNLAGRHNVLNALAAMAVAHELGVPDEAILRGLRGFQGIGRRFQMYGEITAPGGRVMMIDDYGHHPREIQAVIQAIRDGWPGRRLVLVFQPHRFTRTRDLFEDFSAVLSEVDELLMLEVYPAGEPAIPGVDSRTLCRAIRARGRIEPVFVQDGPELARVLQATLTEGDILLTMGAGDIGALAARLGGQLCGEMNS
jgi:UDP-N-acetylmuramate--alanine ligase